MDALDPVTRMSLRGAFDVAGTACIVGGLAALFGAPVGAIALGVILITSAEMDRRAERRGE